MPGDSPSLVTSVESVPGASPRAMWSRQQKRVFQRTLACFHYWRGHGYQVLWVMLSSSPNSIPGTLSKHHKALRRVVEREYSLPGLEHCTVETREGHGVLHALWAWRGKKAVFIPQKWLCAEWDRIHGARITWIARVRRDPSSGKRISRYMVSQYIAKQGALVRLSWSWKTFGLPIVNTWRDFRASFRGRLGAVGMALWRRFLEGACVALPDGSAWDLEYVRANGPPDLSIGCRWARGNYGGPLPAGNNSEAQFSTGGHSWRTRGPLFRWELAEA